MRRKLSSLKTMIVVLMPSIALLLAACGPNKTDDVIIDLGNQDVSVVLPPGYPDLGMDGGFTLLIQGFSGTPVVHSFPQFAGVHNEGDIGIGSAAGFDPGDSFTLPINANLGTQLLSSYTVCITMDSAAVQLTGVLGSDHTLYESYDTEYKQAVGFEAVPDKIPGNPFYIGTSGGAATGRVNLARLQFTINQPLPPTGVHLTFQVMELKDSGGNDICPNFSAGGCSTLGISGIVVNNFHIQPPKP